MDEIIMDEAVVYELEPETSGISGKGLLIGGAAVLALGAGYLLVKKVIIPAYRNYKIQKRAAMNPGDVVDAECEDVES